MNMVLALASALAWLRLDDMNVYINTGTYSSRYCKSVWREPRQFECAGWQDSEELARFPES